MQCRALLTASGVCCFCHLCLVWCVCFVFKVDGTKDRPITIKGLSSGGTAIVKGDDSSEACVEINHDFYVLDVRTD